MCNINAYGTSLEIGAKLRKEKDGKFLNVTPCKQIIVSLKYLCSILSKCWIVEQIHRETPIMSSHRGEEGIEIHIGYN